MKRFIPILAALAAFTLAVSGCAAQRQWIGAHKSQLFQSGAVIGRQVLTVALPALAKAVAQSRNPAATQDWQDYFAANLNAQKWETLAKTPNLILSLNDIWKAQAPAALKPGVDLFNRLWLEKNPRTEAEVGAFILAYTEALNASRAALEVGSSQPSHDGKEAL